MDKLPSEFLRACRQTPVRLTHHLLLVSVARQRMRLWEAATETLFHVSHREYLLRREYVISTSRFGSGQIKDSNQTPLGLHRVARKIGAGQPVGTVFRARQPVGFTWQGQPEAAIAHRILWLEGLQPGFNRGGNCDTFERYIYIHGLGDELTLGRPASRGCVHMAAADLLPLFDRVPRGTLVWIQ